jgi:hypothetical protein
VPCRRVDHCCLRRPGSGVPAAFRFGRRAVGAEVTAFAVAALAGVGAWSTRAGPAPAAGTGLDPYCDRSVTTYTYNYNRKDHRGPGLRLPPTVGKLVNRRRSIAGAWIGRDPRDPGHARRSAAHAITSDIEVIFDPADR